MKARLARRGQSLFPNTFKAGFVMLHSPAVFLEGIGREAQRLAGRQACSRIEAYQKIFDGYARTLREVDVAPRQGFGAVLVSETPELELCNANTTARRGPGVRAFCVFQLTMRSECNDYDVSATPSSSVLCDFCRFLLHVYPKRETRRNPGPHLKLSSCYAYLHAVYELFLRGRGISIFGHLPNAFGVLEVPYELVKLRDRWASERNAQTVRSLPFSVHQRNGILERVHRTLEAEILERPDGAWRWDLEVFMAAFACACQMGWRISHYGATSASDLDRGRLLTRARMRFKSPDESFSLSFSEFMSRKVPWLLPAVGDIAFPNVTRGLLGVVSLSWGPHHKALPTGTMVTRPLFPQATDPWCGYTLLTCFLTKIFRAGSRGENVPIFIRWCTGAPVDGEFMNFMIRKFIAGIGELGGASPLDLSRYTTQSARSFYLTMARERGIPDEIAFTFGQWTKDSTTARRVYDRPTSNRFRPTIDIAAVPLDRPMGR